VTIPPVPSPDDRNAIAHVVALEVLGGREIDRVPRELCARLGVLEVVGAATGAHEQVVASGHHARIGAPATLSSLVVRRDVDVDVRIPRHQNGGAIQVRIRPKVVDAQRLVGAVPDGVIGSVVGQAIDLTRTNAPLASSREVGRGVDRESELGRPGLAQQIDGETVTSGGPERVAGEVERDAHDPRRRACDRHVELACWRTNSSTGGRHVDPVEDLPVVVRVVQVPAIEGDALAARGAPIHREVRDDVARSGQSGSCAADRDLQDDHGEHECDGHRSTRSPRRWCSELAIALRTIWGHGRMERPAD
jgi:hypothetical protein